MWPSRDVRYESGEWRDSNVCKGVRYEVARMSLALRAEVTAAIRGLANEMEFAAAGTTVVDQLRAAELGAGVDAALLRCGLLQIDGLQIDGREADVEQLIARGPEDLSREIAEAVRRSLGLSEAERKN